MKNLFLLLILCSGVLLFSCGDDDEMTMNTDPFITATIDGDAFAATAITAVSDTTFGEEIIFSSGTDADPAFTIGLNIPTSIAVNTPITVDGFDFGITFTDPANNTFTTVGTLELTTNDTSGNILEGTFSFTAEDSNDPTVIFTIADGAFRLEY